MRPRASTAGRFGDDQAGAAHRPAAEMHQVPIVGKAVLARILAHRRDSDAVAKGDAADGQGREEIWHTSMIASARSLALRCAWKAPGRMGSRRLADRGIWRRGACLLLTLLALRESFPLFGKTSYQIGIVRLFRVGCVKRGR